MTQFDVILQSRAGRETVRVTAPDAACASVLAHRPGTFVSCITPVASAPLTVKRKA